MCLNSKLKFGGHKRCDSEDVIIWLKGHVTVWAGAYQGNIPSGQVGGHRHCVSEDIMIFICCMILQNYVIKEPCYFMGGPYQGKLLFCQLWWPWTLWQCRYNDFRLACYLAKLRDQRVMWLFGQEPIKLSYHPAKLGGHRHSGSQDMFLVCHVILAWGCNKKLLD